jgi:xanthine dehydrogenase accessory factor
VDERPEQLAHATGASRNVAGGRTPVPGHYVVIATYNHDLDFQILKDCLAQTPAPTYVGVVASARKQGLFRRRLREEGIEPGGIVHMPAGLDLGGRGPDEIALSILAEVQAIRHGRGGHRHLGRL